MPSSFRPMRVQLTNPILIAMTLLLQPVPSFSEKEAGDRVFKPVITLEYEHIYDNHDSIPNQKVVDENKELTKPVADFFKYLTDVLDNRDSSETDLQKAYAQLENWAEAGAMLDAPTSQPKTFRTLYVGPSLGFVILKFRMRGVKVSQEVVHWYAKMASDIEDDTATLPNNDSVYARHYSNVYPWGGVAGALSAVISNNSKGRAYADEVWNTELKEIQPSGITAAEITRKARSLVYHQQTASGMIVLHYLRKRLGVPDDEQQLDRLGKLTQMIGKSLCDPTWLAEKADAKIEIPGTWGFRYPYAFDEGLLPKTWYDCGPKDMVWETMGGDTKVSAQAVDAAHGSWLPKPSD